MPGLPDWNDCRPPHLGIRLVSAEDARRLSGITLRAMPQSRRAGANGRESEAPGNRRPRGGEIAVVAYIAPGTSTRADNRAVAHGARCYNGEPCMSAVFGFDACSARSRRMALTIAIPRLPGSRRDRRSWPRHLELILHHHVLRSPQAWRASQQGDWQREF